MNSTWKSNKSNQTGTWTAVQSHQVTMSNIQVKGQNIGKAKPVLPKSKHPDCFL